MAGRINQTDVPLTACKTLATGSCILIGYITICTLLYSITPEKIRSLPTAILAYILLLVVPGVFVPTHKALWKSFPEAILRKATLLFLLYIFCMFIYYRYVSLYNNLLTGLAILTGLSITLLFADLLLNSGHANRSLDNIHWANTPLADPAMKRELREFLEEETKKQKQWEKQFEINAEKLANLIDQIKADPQNAEKQAIDIGVLAWQSGGLQCMKKLHQMARRRYREIHTQDPVLDPIESWWDGLGQWKDGRKINK